MELSSSSSLDTLATTGVIDFDADAYVKGAKPRYVGNPGAGQYLPLEQPINSPANFGIKSGKNLPGNPEADAFVRNYNEKKEQEGKEETEGKKPPSLQTLLAGGIIAALALFAGNKINKHMKANPDSFKGIKEKWNTFKDKVKNFFSGSTEKSTESTTKEAAAKTAEQTEQAAKKGIIEKAKNLLKGAKDKFMKLPKKGKIGVGIGAGLLGLYALYKATSRPSEAPQE